MRKLSTNTYAVSMNGMIRWSAPFAGLLVGVGIACLEGIVGGGHDKLGFWPPIFMGAGLGFAAGIIVMLADPSGWQTEDEGCRTSMRPSFSANVLALIALLAFFMPFFGPALSLLALWANLARRRGWAWYISWVAFVLSVSMTSLIVWTWMHRQ